MERKIPKRNSEKVSRLNLLSKNDFGLASILAGYCCSKYYSKDFSKLFSALTEACGRSPVHLSTLQEFWTPALERAVVQLVGRYYAEEIYQALLLRMEGQLSNESTRRSYHSAHFGYYFYSIINLLEQLVNTSCYTETVEELLYCGNDYIPGYKYLLALALRRKEEPVYTLVQEALLGDNTQVLLTRSIIEAVIISKDEALLNDLYRLLLAARLQEGLRQQILESADVGSLSVLTHFLKLCLDEDLFRYSAVIRAFGTWTGLGYDNTKPASIRRYAQYAYGCLTDPVLRQEYLNSGDNQKAYFALWSMGCDEIRDCEAMVEQLLWDKHHYRQILGWFYVSQSDSDVYKTALARKHLQERDEELLAWVVSCLPESRLFLYRFQPTGEAWNTDLTEHMVIPSDSSESLQLFLQLKETALFIHKKQRTFSGNPFDFVSVTLHNARVIQLMLSIAKIHPTLQLIDQLFPLLQFMDAEQRQVFLSLLDLDNASHRTYLRAALHDRSVLVKEAAVQRLAKTHLQPEDYAVLAEAMCSKSSTLRQLILALLKKQKAGDLKPMLRSLLNAEAPEQQQAALELLLELHKQNPQLQMELSEPLAQLQQKKLSTQTQILLEQLLDAQEPGTGYTKANGFGLYDPAVPQAFAQSLPSIQKPGFWGKVFKVQNEDLLSPSQIKALFPSWAQVDALLNRMNQVFIRHGDYEYEATDWSGQKIMTMFGNAQYDLLLPFEHGINRLDHPDARVEMVPFYTELLDAMGELATDPEKFVALLYVLEEDYSSFRPGMKLESWFLPYERRSVFCNYYDEARQKYKDHFFQLHTFIRKVLYRFDAHQLFVIMLRLYRSMVSFYGEETLGRCYVSNHELPAQLYTGEQAKFVINHPLLKCLRQLLYRLPLSEEDRKTWFLQQYRIEKIAQASTDCGLTLDDHLLAQDRGYAPREVLFETVLAPENAYYIRVLTNSLSQKLVKTYLWLQDFTPALLERIVSIEEKRGELPGPFTNHSRFIERIEGVSHFCNLLSALGAESFFRGYQTYRDATKKASLSHLLKCCYPAREDTAEHLAARLMHTDITEKRLVEAAMYAPQWAGFVEKLLGWNGLKCGVWFFHAHINELFSAEKETEVALYSPITPLQFNDGTFDKNWFFEAYDQLGPKHFDLLYKSAKYITDGSNQHRRSQLYTDAVLGRLDATELRKEISEKRNQDKLRCFPLLPMAKDDTHEALSRYEFIQKFLKESKQFGAQRRESEKKACAAAMENLAVAVGLTDVNRLIWQMESAKMSQVLPYMEPTLLDGVSLSLQINEQGDAGLRIEKNGKQLRTLPKFLSKNVHVLTLKELVKGLKEQKIRAKTSLEHAMITSAYFSIPELSGLLSNPVLCPLFENLLWTDDQVIGFLSKKEAGLVLAPLSGPEKTLQTEMLRPAHPYDLQQAQVWANYMQLLYQQQRVQPFKQVFREYYPLTADEADRQVHTYRYAGHQVQPQKAIALLRTRGWTVDYDEGLQKVYYQENLVARVYSLATWFSPADIEAPTLETIQFFDRRNETPVLLENVPPIVFSETMRDLDMMVSVAHVGGVDPEASHSTVEMRLAIAKELTALLQLNNISWRSAHALIRGKLSNYSVHLGSGIVHAEGKGMVSIVPVHTQARGRIFLPFADDDPKTAEIISKIVLLSEDHKLKDPSILCQITT